MTHATAMSPIFRVCLLLAFTTLGASVDATTFYVRKTGDDGNSGLAPNVAFSTINHAIARADQGDVIWVGAGDYGESLALTSAVGGDISLPLSIRADLDGSQTGDRGDVVVRPPQYRWAIMITSASRVHVDGVTFAKPDVSTGYAYGGLIRNSLATGTFNDCRFDGLRYGLLTYDGASTSLTACSFTDNIIGVYGYRSTALSLDACSVQGATYGLYLYLASSVSAHDCQFSASATKATSYPVFANQSSWKSKAAESKRPFMGSTVVA